MKPLQLLSQTPDGFSPSAAQSIFSVWFCKQNEYLSILFCSVNLILLSLSCPFSPSGLVFRKTAFSRICLVSMVTGLRQTQKNTGPNRSHSCPTYLILDCAEEDFYEKLQLLIPKVLSWSHFLFVFKVLRFANWSGLRLRMPKNCAWK